MNSIIGANGAPVRDGFKPGDVVRLKSGGPRMTVAQTERCTDGLVLYVHWFIPGDDCRGMKIPDAAVVIDNG